MYKKIHMDQKDQIKIINVIKMFHFPFIHSP